MNKKMTPDRMTKSIRQVTATTFAHDLLDETFMK